MRTITTSAVIALALIALGIQLVHGDDDEHGHWERNNPFKPTLDVAPAADPLYRDECGGCHMAYPPGLLPARSWRAILYGLDEHFGDDAGLEAATALKIGEYLLANSADKSTHRRSIKIMRRLSKGETPLGISQMRYFKHKHDEIPRGWVTNNERVASLSNCPACHGQAESGSFRESEIVIPGHGPWDD